MTRLAVAVLALSLAAGAQARESKTPSTPSTSPAPLRLTLSAALVRALAVSPNIAQRQALARAAGAAVRGAEASYGPRVDATGSYQRNSDIPELAFPVPGRGLLTVFPNIPDNYRSRFDVTVPVYTGGRLEGLEAAARHEDLAAGKDVASARADQLLETTTAYWSLVSTRDSARVLAEAIASYESHLADTIHRQQAGMAARSEVLAVRVERDRADLARIQAENSAAVAEANLVRLLDLPASTRIQADDPLAAVPPAAEDLESLIRSALSHRPERVASKARWDSALARVGASRAAKKPQVTAGAGYEYDNPNPRILPPSATFKDTWDASVRVSFNVFDAGATAAEVAQAREKAAALASQLEELDRRIRLQVTQRRLELETARKAVAVAERNVTAARENTRETAERYRAGVATNTERLDAEVAELRTGLDRTEAYSQLRVAVANLDRAVGRP